MKIIQCIPSIDETTGGPPRSVTYLVEALGEIKKVTEVNLLTIKSEKPLVSQFLNSKCNLEFYTTGLLHYSARLNHKLRSAEVELFHGHGLWQLPVHQMAVVARKRNIPYVISIRGMLETWSLTQSRWKKEVAMQFFQFKDLKEADCLHATAIMEVESIRKLGLINPIACIPNGINIFEFPQKDYTQQPCLKKRVLFLSRIHAKKGIELLIEAWAAIDLNLKKDWIIDIAGNGEIEYINQLNVLIKTKGLENQITIVGPKFGKEKVSIYHSADIFVLPTYSENFGIVIAEALCCGVPVITTKGTPWADLITHNAGWWIDVGVEPLKNALIDAMQTKKAKLVVMGLNGRKLIQDKYSIGFVAEQMMVLYNWILSKGKKPKFVHTIDN